MNNLEILERICLYFEQMKKFYKNIALVLNQNMQFDDENDISAVCKKLKSEHIMELR